MEQVKFHFDPGCPWCYQTSRWAVKLERLGEIEIEWAVFSLGIVNAPEGSDIRSLEVRTGPALRTVIMIRREGRQDLVGAFYTALGKRIWEQTPPEPDIAAASRSALEEIGLDPGLCDKALQDISTWDEVIEEHRGLVERTRSFGVPSIVLDGGEGPAIFGPVITRVPDDANAVELWNHVVWLTRYDDFSELKRQRTTRPDLPGEVWRREQRRSVAGS